MICTPVHNRAGKEAVEDFRREFKPLMVNITSKADRKALYTFVLHTGNSASAKKLLEDFKAIALLPKEYQIRLFDWFETRGRLLPDALAS